MSNGQTGRRRVLKTGGVALLAGLTGCTGVLTGDTDDGGLPDIEQDTWNFMQHLPSHSLGSDGEFRLTRPAAVYRDQTKLTAKESARILNRTVGESGWIPDHKIDDQIVWHASGRQGYAFTTPLGKEKIISRYEESFLREVPVGTYEGYSLFERSNSWHAVNDEGVIKVPSDERADVESYLDSLDSDRTPVSEIELLLDVLDSRYSLSVDLFNSAPRKVAVSHIEHYGSGYAVSPNPDETGFTLTVGYLTNSPRKLAKWVRDQVYVFFRDLKLRNPTVQTNGDLVLLEETGTVDAFDGY